MPVLDGIEVLENLKEHLFFFNVTATTEIYTTYDTLSLHDALPISSTGFIENCVTVLKTRLPCSSVVPASASWSGTMSVSGRSAMTTAAAWIDELRTMPSSPRATSMIWRAVGSSS